VHNALDILRDELRRDMALCGQTSIKRLPRDCVFRVD
jgi:isopentenyl diphosphate isomerase/L-lactate dehydrogenase-like FMN-dependent dehydrogenase